MAEPHAEKSQRRFQRRNRCWQSSYPSAGLQSRLKGRCRSYYELWATQRNIEVSYEDVDRLKGLAATENTRVPHFLQDYDRYMEQLDKIMGVNELSDRELQELIP
ncbi:putative tyrosine carboxypeptidase MATCAP2 [Erinaceus europaeus]|uniref:Tyrosine carboxypeptidase MATCAP2 n=1 Tax=Erinaceus europaeus TaxID=9365 RepID=A0ABM3XSM9_ERIEU|nr:putative tyrosine carboxypeptidase MATCAP2 [Erinaceus europaeus]